MDRRELLLAAAATAGAVTGAAATSTAAQAAPRTVCPKAAAPKANLRVRDWGQGKPIVFLSGWALPSDFWHYHIADLSGRGFRCIAYDRRGHGRSDDPSTGYNFDTLADDLASVLNGLDLNDVTLVAYSMGGGEAARYLSRHGSKRVSRVVFLAATTPFLLQTADNPIGVPGEMFEGLRGLLAQDFPKWVVDSNDAYWLNLVSAEMQAWGRNLMLQSSLPALLAINKAMVETDFRPDLKAISIPALVIHGDKDASAPLPLTGSQTAKLVPGAQFKLYEGAAHGLPLTHRARFTEDLIAFVGMAA
jgi:non-heme chloroperoxidase